MIPTRTTQSPEGHIISKLDARANDLRRIGFSLPFFHGAVWPRGMGFATSIGKYHLGRTIGEGNFAKVKLAVNTETNKNVAVKIIDKKMVLQNKLMYQVSGLCSSSCDRYQMLLESESAYFSRCIKEI